MLERKGGTRQTTAPLPTPVRVWLCEYRATGKTVIEKRIISPRSDQVHQARSRVTRIRQLTEAKQETRDLKYITSKTKRNSVRASQLMKMLRSSRSQVQLTACTKPHQDLPSKLSPNPVQVDDPPKQIHHDAVALKKPHEDQKASEAPRKNSECEKPHPEGGGIPKALVSGHRVEAKVPTLLEHDLAASAVAGLALALDHLQEEGDVLGLVPVTLLAGDRAGGVTTALVKGKH